MQTEPINSKEKILRNVAPLRTGNKRAPDSVGLADQLARGRHRDSVRVTYFKPQFASQALRPRGDAIQNEKCEESNKPRCFYHKHLCFLADENNNCCFTRFLTMQDTSRRNARHLFTVP